MKRTMIVLMMVGLMTGCDTTQVTKAPHKNARDQPVLESTKNSGDAEPEGNISDDDIEVETDDAIAAASEAEEGDIELDTKLEQPAPAVDGSDETTLNDKSQKRSALSITSVRRQDDDVVIQVKLDGVFKSVPWPARSKSVAIDGVCIDGQETEIELQIDHPGKGVITTASPDLGLRNAGEMALEIGYESRGGCNGAGCQDDNIMMISCSNKVKVTGLK